MAARRVLVGRDQPEQQPVEQPRGVLVERREPGASSARRRPSPVSSSRNGRRAATNSPTASVRLVPERRQAARQVVDERRRIGLGPVALGRVVGSASRWATSAVDEQPAVAPVDARARRSSSAGTSRRRRVGRCSSAGRRARGAPGWRPGWQAAGCRRVGSATSGLDRSAGRSADARPASRTPRPGPHRPIGGACRDRRRPSGSPVPGTTSGERRQRCRTRGASRLGSRRVGRAWGDTHARLVDMAEMRARIWVNLGIDVLPIARRRIWRAGEPCQTRRIRVVRRRRRRCASGRDELVIVAMDAVAQAPRGRIGRDRGPGA